MNYLISLFLAIALVGCATSSKINRVQIGMSKGQVIKIMGEPVSISAKGNTEYLNYKLSETSDDAFYGFTTPYYERLVNGKVESYGRTGDFDSTQKPTLRIKKDENIKIQSGRDLSMELRKLRELRDDGILTEEEYQERKRKLLSQD